MTAWCDPVASVNTLQSWVVALVRAGTYNFLSAVDTCSNLRFNLDFTVCIHSTSPRLLSIQPLRDCTMATPVPGTCQFSELCQLLTSVSIGHSSVIFLFLINLKHPLIRAR